MNENGGRQNFRICHSWSEEGALQKIALFRLFALIIF
jgi:hypothetical protein